MWGVGGESSIESKTKIRKGKNSLPLSLSLSLTSKLNCKLAYEKQLNHNTSSISAEVLKEICPGLSHFSRCKKALRANFFKHLGSVRHCFKGTVSFWRPFAHWFKGTVSVKGNWWGRCSCFFSSSTIRSLLYLSFSKKNREWNISECLFDVYKACKIGCYGYTKLETPVLVRTLKFSSGASVGTWMGDHSGVRRGCCSYNYCKNPRSEETGPPLQNRL